MSTTKKLWIGIGILVLLAPLGVVIPALFGAGGAWGEWGMAEIEKIVGFVPEGMRRLSGWWKSPLPEYALPGQSTGIFGKSIGYLLAAAVGALLTAGAGYLLAKFLSRKDHKG